MTTIINNKTYEMACTLRVAFMIQGQHNHKPYSAVFADIKDMTLEEQIGILYCSFKVANPESGITKQDFMDYYMDNYNIKFVMGQIEEVIKGVMGLDDADVEAAKSQVANAQGNK